MHLSIAVPGVNSGSTVRNLTLLSFQDNTAFQSAAPPATSISRTQIVSRAERTCMPAEESVDENKKMQNVSLTFPKHFGASNCKKERDKEGERQKGEEQGEK